MEYLEDQRQNLLNNFTRQLFVNVEVFAGSTIKREGRT